MKYIGYVLFLFIFFAVAFIAPAKKFFFDSLDLAPEITILVSVFYVYNVLLTLFISVLPSKSKKKDRANFYNVHIKMSCSVMVSLGLVGTFLGLVDMISGISAALSGDEADFGKRMAVLLTAISASLGAMAFAFMTSILGVGLSAYSIVAATFVGSGLVANKKKAEEDEKLALEQKEMEKEREKEEKEKERAKEEAQTKAAEMIPIVTNIIETTFKPLAKQLELMEQRQIKLLEYLTSDNAFKNRLEIIETKMASLDLSSIEKQLTPLALIEAINEQQQILVAHNENISQGLRDLSSHHIELNQQLTRVSSVMEGHATQTSNQTEALEELQGKLKENSDAIGYLDTSFVSASDKVKIITDKLKHLFN